MFNVLAMAGRSTDHLFNTRFKLRPVAGFDSFPSTLRRKFAIFHFRRNMLIVNHQPSWASIAYFRRAVLVAGFDRPLTQLHHTLSFLF